MSRKARSKAVAIAYGDTQSNPLSGSSLVPMLVMGLALTFAGMIVALVLS